MFINPSNSTAFGVNLNSPKLKYNKQDFFVRIRGYGQNPLWANKTIETANTAVTLIRKDTAPENVLKFIAAGIAKANKFCLEMYKRQHSGLLRTYRDGWKSDEDGWGTLATGYGDKTRYKNYQERLDKVCKKPLIRPNENIGMTRPNEYRLLRHSKAEDINSSLDYTLKLCEKIFPKFIHQDIRQEDLKEVNKTIAEIRWVLAHATPWSRGSDAISNVFIRAIYKAIGVKTYPLKKGVSLDLEAYCTQLSDYKGNFSSYFEKPPEIVE